MDPLVSALQRLGIDPLVSMPSPGSTAQTQTENAFGFKWSQRATYESPTFQAATRTWLLERYCGGDERVVGTWLGGGGRLILDAGCGAGNPALLLFGEHLKSNDYLGVDISSAIDVARQRFSELGLPGDFLRANLMELPVPDGSIDLALSEGVLHHTDNTAAALAAVVRKVKVGGRVMFYVYAKKAPLREFADDHIRSEIRALTDAEAWDALMPLTRLGMALGQLGATVNIPDDVPQLGIKKGQYDLQRFIYWHFCKMYYREDFSEAENNHVNFDWYRPLNSHRHTPEEVRAWCDRLHLAIERLDIQEAGITVVAIRQA